MKRNQTHNKYPLLTQLPREARSVSEYAKDENISSTAVYKRYINGKVQIVVFSGFNYILPIDFKV